MTAMILRQYEGKEIRQKDDGWFSLTDMAKATDKQVNDYLRLESTDAFLKALSSETGIPVSGFVGVSKGGTPANQGTWAHPQVAMHFAYWASPKLQVHVTRWMLEKLERTPPPAVAVTDERLREMLEATVKAYIGAGQVDVSRAATVTIRERIHQRCDRASATDCRRIVGRVLHWARHYRREVFPEGMQEAAPLCVLQEDIWLVDKAIDEVWERHKINGLPLFRLPENQGG